MANAATHRGEFLRRLAEELRNQFQVGLALVQSPDWSSPMMLVADETMAQHIDRDAMRAMVESATTAPIACDVPCRGADNDESPFARGIRIAFGETETRAAVLLIYAQMRRPSSVDQIQDLQKLKRYADASGPFLGRMPAEEPSQPGSSAHGANAAAPSRAEGQLITTNVLSNANNRNALLEFHRDLDLNATAHRIANASRRLLQADRVTVLVPHRGKLRVKAISGVAVADSRSNSVKAIEQFVRAVTVMGKPLQTAADQQLPPQVQQPLDDYLDECGVASATVLPLRSPDRNDSEEADESQPFNPIEGDNEVVGVIVLESFADQRATGITSAMMQVATEAAYSLRNSSEHRRVLGLPVMKAAGNVVHSKRVPWLMAGVFALVGFLVAGSLIQVDHHVIATGSVEPLQRRQVFAAVDGIITDVLVKDGQQVEKGQPLFQLENADLESRGENLSGQLQTKSRQLASLRSVRLTEQGDALKAGRMALEERQLESELANLRAQLDVVRRQQDELVVTSPLSGSVVGWQLAQRLSDRPVSRGNLLASVVDAEGDWTLKLQVPDADMGAVLDALEVQTDLPIRFAVATEPQRSYSASLVELATAARLSESGQQVVDLTATVTPTPAETSGLDTFRPTDVRVDADVTARIACGRRCLLASWFSDVIDFTHRNVLFYLR